MELDIQLNRISVKGSVRRGDQRRICAGLYQTIVERKYLDVILDFSVCERITEAVMLPIIPIAVNYRESSNVSFELILPQNDQLRRLFLNANWAHHFDPDGFDSSMHEGGHVPSLRFGGTDEQSEILDRVMELILRQLQTDRETLKAIEWSLGEIMDNVSNHAQSPVGGFVQATAYERQNRVEFVVADAGIGIPKSMGMEHFQHNEALMEAINEGVTSDKTRNAGNGLYGSYQVSTISEGQFEIHSSNGSLFFDNPEKGLWVAQKKHHIKEHLSDVQLKSVTTNFFTKLSSSKAFHTIHPTITSSVNSKMRGMK